VRTDAACSFAFSHVCTNNRIHNSFSQNNYEISIDAVSAAFAIAQVIRSIFEKVCAFSVNLSLQRSFLTRRQQRKVSIYVSGKLIHAAKISIARSSN
jgi:hypothetical protein